MLKRWTEFPQGGFYRLWFFDIARAYGEGDCLGNLPSVSNKSLTSQQSSLLITVKNKRFYVQNTTFAKKNVTLRCDFVCESRKLIIEYDERQHFSEARRIALEAYEEVGVSYNRSLWIKACNDIILTSLSKGGSEYG